MTEFAVINISPYIHKVKDKLDDLGAHNVRSIENDKLHFQTNDKGIILNLVDYLRDVDKHRDSAIVDRNEANVIWCSQDAGRIDKDYDPHAKLLPYKRIKI